MCKLSQAWANVSSKLSDMVAQQRTWSIADRPSWIRQLAVNRAGIHTKKVGRGDLQQWMIEQARTQDTVCRCANALMSTNDGRIGWKRHPQIPSEWFR